MLTAKHHDGFYLFDTKGISGFDSMHTPFKADVIKIFVDECHRQGVAPFLYFATDDWHNPKYLGLCQSSVAKYKNGATPCRWHSSTKILMTSALKGVCMLSNPEIPLVSNK